MKRLLLCLVVAVPLVAQAPPAASNAPARQAGESRTWSDAARLASLLYDIEHSTVNVSAATWRTLANEANVLANRVYASSRGTTRTAARELRTHVRAMRTAALAGDATAAREHSGPALDAATKIVNATVSRR